MLRALPGCSANLEKKSLISSLCHAWCQMSWWESYFRFSDVVGEWHAVTQPNILPLNIHLFKTWKRLRLRGLYLRLLFNNHLLDVLHKHSVYLFLTVQVPFCVFVWPVLILAHSPVLSFRSRCCCALWFAVARRGVHFRAAIINAWMVILLLVNLNFKKKKTIIFALVQPLWTDFKSHGENSLSKLPEVWHL